MKYYDELLHSKLVERQFYEVRTILHAEKLSFSAKIDQFDTDLTSSLHGASGFISASFFACFFIPIDKVDKMGLKTEDRQSIGSSQRDSGRAISWLSVAGFTGNLIAI